MSYKPPFTVSADAISMIAEIAARVERYAIRLELTDAVRLRRVNKIKTIHSSLAIEGNSLTESQVSDILDGKRVIAPLREIQEIKNAIATYELAPKLDPFSLKDLLKAHETMMLALVERPGHFRTGGIGVFSGMKIVHAAPPANRVPVLMGDLFDWLKNARDHLLVRSCVFHYEFEFIHPFADGNGRMGRLWQSLILGGLHPVFLHLPVESMVHDNQREYYRAINESSTSGDSGVFIDFMLREILHALEAHQGAQYNVSGGVNGGVNGGVMEVLDYIKATPGCRANMLAADLNMPLRTVQRHLGLLKNRGKIEYVGAPRNGGYYARGLMSGEE